MSRRFQGQTLAWVDWLERPDWAMTKLTWALPERQRLIVALLPRLVPSGLKVVEIRLLEIVNVPANAAVLARN